jgi:hypothetical protein
LVNRLEVGEALLEVAHVLDAGLEDGELVHVLASASWDHVLEHAKLFVHFGSPPPFDEAVGRLARHFASGGSSGAWRLFPLGSGRG